PTRYNLDTFLYSSCFGIEIDGVSADYDFTFVDFENKQTEQGCHSILTLHSNVKDFNVKVHTIIDGNNAYTRYLEIENLSENSMALSRSNVFSGGIQCNYRDVYSSGKPVDTHYSYGYFKNDAPVYEGDFCWKPLLPEVTTINTRFRRDRFRHPLLFLRNNFSGEIWYFQTGWSGGCSYELDFNAHNSRHMDTVAFRAAITGYAPLYVIAAGETYTSPEFHMAMSNKGFDDVVQNMHEHMRNTIFTISGTDASEALIGCGMGAEHDMSVETTKAFIRQMKEMGGEVFIIDAGWACPPAQEMGWGRYNGVNVPNVDRYPNGIGEIRDYCHELGMKFSLWVEIERIGDLCNLYNEKPEWYPTGKTGNQYKGFLDFTNPEVAKWAEDELSRIITEYKLDMLRVDYNIDGRHVFAIGDSDGTKECISVRHINAVYNMYRNLKKKFPNVIFEGCAAGGGRTDTGFMKAFNHTWVTDWQRMPRSIVITNGMTMALPPEKVDRLFAGMGCHEFGSAESQMRNTMFGHMSLNVISPAMFEANPELMEFVKHSTEIYKSFIRPFLSRSKIYHHTPVVGFDKDTSTVVLEISDNDNSKGAVGIFNLGPEINNTVVKFKGVKADRDYMVTLDNTRSTFRMSGAELKLKGIDVDIPVTMSSELILYEEVK
ncbi:MAG: alpha-galactosidase, partial [Clostridia bacterium]|nr:alpha-galactosidase [Clostridia bacterium]